MKHEARVFATASQFLLISTSVRLYKNSYTEETINLFAKFGFELLKPCAGGNHLNKLPINGDVLNIESIKYHNNLDSIFNTKTIVFLLMLARCCQTFANHQTTLVQHQNN